MTIEFRKIDISDSAILANFLSSEEWDFFVHQYSSAAECLEKINDFFVEDKESFLIYYHNVDFPIGLIEIFDISSEPWFSLRLKKEYRKKGIGKKSLEFLTDHVFINFSDIYRINASTREDNFPMQKIFLKCLWLKEGYLREALKTSDGRKLAALHYGIIRKDWESKTVTTFTWMND